MNVKKVVSIVLVVMIIFALVLFTGRLVAVHQVYKILDLENSDIYYDISCHDLKKLKGDPEDVAYNVCDTSIDQYYYKSVFMDKAAKICYDAAPNVIAYEVVVKNLTDKEGQVLFAKTTKLCKERIGKIPHYKENIKKKANVWAGEISVPCAKYGVTINMPETKDFEWCYKDGEFTLRVSDPVDSLYRSDV